MSVVVPVYNLEFYIERCLASLAAQTCDDFEVLVVNDGGTDDSQLIIDEYVAAYPHIFRPYKKENGGHGSACNYGIERATGEYVMIVDGDDFLDPDTIEFMYEKAKALDVDLLIGNLLYIFNSHSEPYIPIRMDKDGFLDEKDRFRLYQNWPTPCGRIYKRSLFNDPEIRFLPGVIFADANFAPKTYLVAERIYYVNKELYNYDITRPTQSLKQTDKRVLNIIPVLRDMLEFHRKKGVFEQKRDALMHYTARHCVAWIRRVQTLNGYPRLQALQEIFAVADDYFGSDWLKSGIVYQHFGRRAYWFLRFARPLGYRPLIWVWEGIAAAQKWDARFDRMFGFPQRAYRGVKRRVKARIGPLPV